MQRLICLAFACLAAGCAPTPPTSEPAVAPCDPPVTVPDRDLTAGDMLTLWHRDRTALRICGARVDALIGAK